MGRKGGGLDQGTPEERTENQELGVQAQFTCPNSPKRGTKVAVWAIVWSPGDSFSPRRSVELEEMQPHGPPPTTLGRFSAVRSAMECLVRVLVSRSSVGELVGSLAGMEFAIGLGGILTHENFGIYDVFVKWVFDCLGCLPLIGCHQWCCLRGWEVFVCCRYC